MAKDGKKLELYEILAAKRDKGKVPLGLNVPAKQANSPDPQPEITDAPGLIIDEALGPIITAGENNALAQGETVNLPPPKNRVESIKTTPPPAPAGETRRSVSAVTRHEPAEPRETRRADATKTVPERPSTVQRASQKTVTADYPEAEPRLRSPREVVFALDTALIFFTVVLALIGCSYFIGYKRGQEEKPAGLAGAEIESADATRLGFRTLSREPRSIMLPPEQDYTLIIRKEPADDNDLPERLELELAEALSRGRQQAGREIPGFIFRTVGGDPHYILAVGLGQSANDQGLNELLQVFYAMEGVTLSREAKPYRGCRIAPVRELGTPVY